MEGEYELMRAVLGYMEICFMLMKLYMFEFI